MKNGSRYPVILCMVAATIIFPGGVARLFGAPMSVLVPIAAVQLFTTLAFSITTIASVIIAGQSALRKKWKEAAIFFGVALLPIGTWMLVAITNRPGVEGVMSV